MRRKTHRHGSVSAALLAATLFLLLVLLRPASAMESDDYAIPWSVWGSGGGQTGSAGFSLNATVGQASIGFKSSAGYRVCSGFWCELGHHVYLPVVVRGAP